MGLKQIIGAIIFSGAVALTSCSKYKTGTVEKEYGTITENGIFYSSLGKVVAEADAFIKQKYLIQIKSEKELYSVYIISRSGQEESIDDLASNLKEGDKVKFPITSNSLKLFNKKNFGILYSDQIEKLSE